MRPHRITVVVVLLALLLTYQARAAEPGVRLKDPPGSLELPLAAGSNRYLTAVVTGGTPGVVWLAHDADAKSRVELTSAGGGSYQLNLADDAIAKLARSKPDRAGQLKVFARFAGDKVVASPALRYTIVPAAAPLDLPPEGAAVTLAQRTDKPLPGSGGALRLAADDVTGNQVLVSLRPAGQTGGDAAAIIDMVSLGEGDEVAFSWAGERYALRLERLVNRLVGDDHAVFRVTRGPSHAERIDAAIERIAASGLTFVRNGQPHAAAAAAAHLREKRQRAGNAIATYDQFVEHVATKSSLSGEPYQVKLPDGTTMELAKWLRHEPATTKPATRPAS